MNAPAEHLKLDAELVPVGVIVASSTHIQQSRRKRFSEEAILELAQSIKTSGVINPILVRPAPAAAAVGVTPHPKYEIVAGERRYLATKRAGLAHIPCVIRDLDDGQVLEAQLVENLQREDLNPLEEAEGYAELKTLKGYDAEKIGELIGKSKSYVYARLKLNGLSADARKALQQGTLDYSKGLLLARIHSEKLQEKALKILTQHDWRGEPVGYRTAFSELREKFMRPLAAAPFTEDDAGLFRMVKVRKGVEEPEPLPACATCANNSGNDPELQRDLKSDAHVCTNTECFEIKVIAFAARRRKELEQAKVEVVAGEEAKKIIPRADHIVGFVDLDAECEDDDFQEPEPEAKTDEEFDTREFQKRMSEWEERSEAHVSRTYRALLGEIKPDQVKLVEDPKTKKLRELVPITLAREVLEKQHKIELPSWMGKPDTPRSSTAGGFNQKAWEEEQRKQRERQEREQAYRLAVFRGVADKCGGPITREDLVDVADVLAAAWPGREFLKKHAYSGKAPEPAQLKEPELGRFIRLCLVAASVAQTHTPPTPLLAMAKRYKVDAAKIKSDLDDARKAAEKAKPAAAAPSAKKPDAKKKTPAKKAAAKKPAAKKAAKK